MNLLGMLDCYWQVVCGDACAEPRSEGAWRGFWQPGLAPNVVAMALAISSRSRFHPLARDSISTAVSSDGKVGVHSMFTAGLFAGMGGYFVASLLLQIKSQMQVVAGRLGADGRYETGLHRRHAPAYSSAIGAV